jgi:hypothetical protein
VLLLRQQRHLHFSRDRVAVGRALGLGIKECATFKVCEHVRRGRMCSWFGD